MAKVIDSQRYYLNYNIQKSKKRARQVLLAVFLISGFAMAYFNNELFTGKPIGQKLLTILGFFVLYILVSTILLYWFSKKRVQSRKWESGTLAEREATNLLKTLPDSFIVLADLMLPSKGGNIDFVVVGVHSIILVEVKGHKGDISLYNGSLSRNNQPFSNSNIMRQVVLQANNLQDLLKHQFKQNFPIKPIIWFINPLAQIPQTGLHKDNISIYGRDVGLKEMANLFLTPKPIPSAEVIDYLLRFKSRSK